MHCCVSPQVVGKRYHALNMADYDLCANCYENYTGEEIKFEEAELGKELNSESCLLIVQF